MKVALNPSIFMPYLWFDFVRLDNLGDFASKTDPCSSWTSVIAVCPLPLVCYCRYHCFVLDLIFRLVEPKELLSKNMTICLA